MTSTEAAKLLEVSPDATPEQLEARFLDLRRKLEDKIAKAPTPGLQAKYRESLATITTAFETLALAADGSALPVLQRQRTEDGGQRTASGPVSPGGGPATAGPPRGTSPSSPAPRKSGSKEFAIVALIAIAVLAAGGWYIMKTRAEKAEETRLATTAKLAAEEKQRLLEQQQQAAAAEQKRLAEEQRLAAAAEVERREKLLLQSRTRLAEFRAKWEIFDRAERDAGNALNEAKADQRGLRDASAGRQAELAATVRARENYARWLSDFLLRHPARTQRVQAEELISAGAADDAAALTATLVAALPEIEAEIRREQSARLAIAATLVLNSEPAGVEWTVEDSFGRTRTGRTPAEIPNVAGGEVTVALRRANWKERTRKIEINVARGATWTERYADHERTPAWVFKADLAELQAAANDGWAAAKLELGDRYLGGATGKIDPEQARPWYESAHTDGYPGYGARLYLLSSRTAIAPHFIEQVLQFLRDGVEAGDPLSILIWLERRLTHPAEESVSPAKVATAVQKALAQSEAGDRFVSLALATYFESVAEPRDPARAHLLAQSAFKAGNLRALRWLAWKAATQGLKNDNGQPQALVLTTQAAEANDTMAMTDLGNWHFTGTHVPKNPQEAFRWWRMAADAGNPSAQTEVGKAYRDGTGVAQDLAAAITWWRKAAEMNPTAMGELGRAYLWGKGVPANHAEGFMWLRRSAVLNNPYACANLGHAYANGWGVPENDAEALVWWRKGAEVSSDAMAQIGWAYQYGRGASVNYGEALAWLQRADGQNHVDAAVTIGYFYSNGLGVPQNDAEALTWWRKAAASHNPTALYNLGWASSNGRGVRKNEKEAIQYWQRAARLGEADAQTALRTRNLSW